MLRTNQLWGLVLALFTFIGLSGCSKDDTNENRITPFKMEKTYFEVPLKGEQAIYITNGSLDVDLWTEDEGVADIIYSRIDEGTPEARGCIRIARLFHTVFDK